MFKLRRLPKHFTILILELQIFFDDTQWLHFNSLLISLILTPYKSTINGMVKVLGFGTHRTKHNAFLLNSSEVLIKALRYYACRVGRGRSSIFALFSSNPRQTVREVFPHTAFLNNKYFPAKAIELYSYSINLTFHIYSPM